MTVRLTIYGGALAGIVMEMRQSKFLIGRDTDCLLRPGSRTVSRRHCVLLWEASVLKIRDLGSTNGTLVNGRRIDGEVVLVQDDMISVGEITIHVDLSLACAPCGDEIGAETINLAAECTEEYKIETIMTEAEQPPAANDTAQSLPFVPEPLQPVVPPSNDSTRTS